MSRRTFILLLLSFAPGCFRLSDPFYASKPLRADPPERPAESLLFGTIVFEGSIFADSDLQSVWLERVAPPGAKHYTYVTRGTLFRVFQDRPLKGGHFVMGVLPGMYELERLESTTWFLTRPIVWRPTDALRTASRVFITRPGVYDIGCFKIIGNVMSHVACTDPHRAEIFDAAIAGTPWRR